ncbi:hypothetical protein DDM76_12900 [Vibrio cholerae]|nr:hypothetical protein [Vibrio cholerae]
MTEQQLPEGWQMVKFGDIAKHIAKRVEPTETDLEIYVGLEHLDPDSLKIKRHGVPSDVEGQKLLVKKDQIIFGKRRAYQRKVAVADWDCICSAHAMVLEANTKNVIPEFLPFFMQSDVFMNRAVAISEGSLSPTIKWKVLAEQTFPLPSKDEQARFIEILKLNSKCIHANESACLAIEKYQKRLAISFQKMDKAVTEFFPDSEWSLMPLGRLASLEYGKSPKDVLDDNGANPVVGTGGEIGRTNQSVYDKETVIIGRKGTIDKPQYIPTPSWPIDTTFYCIPKEDVSVKWLFYALAALNLRSYNEASGVPSLSRSTLEKIKINKPDLETQKKIVTLFGLIDEMKAELTSKTNSLKFFPRLWINKYLGN